MGFSTVYQGPKCEKQLSDCFLGTPRCIALCLPLHLSESAMAAGAVLQVLELWPQARVILVGSAPALALFAQERIADFVHLKSKGFATSSFWWRVARHLKGSRVDLGINLSNAPSIALLLWIAGAQHRVGFGRGLARWLLTQNAPHISARTLHPVERYQSLLNRGEDSIYPPRFKLGKGERAQARQCLDDYLKGNPLSFVLAIDLLPEVPSEKGHWRHSSFEALFQALALDASLCVLALDATTAAICRKQLRFSFIDLSKGHTLRECMAYVDASDGALCSEGVQQHLAAALRIPLIAPMRFAHSPLPYSAQRCYRAGNGNLPSAWIIEEWRALCANAHVARRRHREEKNF